MERIERRKNPAIRKVLRWLLLLAVMIAVVYGYTRIPYFVVKQNMTLQYNYTYKSYDEVLAKREKYLTEEYFSVYSTYDSVIQQIQFIKEHKESCKLILLELGRREQDGAIPYTLVYELSYEDGETPTQRIHIEGRQEMERCWGIWWKVSGNGVFHSCMDLGAENEHAGHSHE
ncbi:MAG: hypothetical protein ACI4DW_01345 [Lachnospiraceae bacterium]